MPKIMDISVFIGNKYGMLTVTSIERINSILWVGCTCECGNTGTFKLQRLKRNHTRSCGCFKDTIMRGILTTHGMTKTRIHSIWSNMNDRCRRPKNKKYSDYGGRGISVCKEWVTSFEAFRDWSYANGYADNLSIDRIKVDGNYEPGNCRWVTNKDQSRNQRSNHLETYNGETKTVAEWAELYNMNYMTLLGRIVYRGKTIEQALNTPIQQSKRWHSQ